MSRTSWVHPQGDSCICSMICMFYIHRCEQYGGQESPTAYTYMIKEGAWVRFGLYLRGVGFESSAGPSDVGFRGFAYAAANFEPASYSRPRSVSFISVAIRSSSCTINSAIATYIVGKKKKIVRRIKPYSIWFPRNTILIPWNTALLQKLLVPKIRKFMHCVHPVWASGGVVVKTIRYKPAGRGFDSRWCQWNFSVT
jgi:hypothetical protein